MGCAGDGRRMLDMRILLPNVMTKMLRSEQPRGSRRPLSAERHNQKLMFPSNWIRRLRSRHQLALSFHYAATTPSSRIVIPRCWSGSRGIYLEKIPLGTPL